MVGEFEYANLFSEVIKNQVLSGALNGQMLRVIDASFRSS